MAEAKTPSLPSPSEELWLQDARVRKLQQRYEAAVQRLGAEKIQALLERHCPILYLDSRDVHMPSSFNWYLEGCAASYQEVTVAERGSLRTGLDLIQLSATMQCGNVCSADMRKRKACYRTDFRLHVEEARRSGYPRELVDEAPVYGDFRFNEDLNQYEIRYVFFYPYNGWYKVLGCKKAGHHDADVEHCTVQLDPQSLEITSIFYGRHGYVDGEWVPRNDIVFEEAEDISTETGALASRPVMYVARGFHGVYPRPGHFWRLNGVVRDDADGLGVKWTPKRVVNISLRPENLTEESAWAWYSGCVGSDGISAPNTQRWFFEEYRGPKKLNWLTPYHHLALSAIMGVSIYLIVVIIRDKW